MSAGMAELGLANQVLAEARNLNARLRRGLGLPPATPGHWSRGGDVYVYHEGEMIAWWDESLKNGIVQEDGGHWIVTHDYEAWEIEAQARQARLGGGTV